MEPRLLALAFVVVGLLAAAAFWRLRAAPPAPPAPAPPAPAGLPVSAVNAATLWAGVSGATVPPYVHLDLLVPVPPGADPLAWAGAPARGASPALAPAAATLELPGVPPPLGPSVSLPVYSVFTAAAPGPSSFGAVGPGLAVVTLAFPAAQVAALQAALFPQGGYVSEIAAPLASVRFAQ